MTTLTVGSRGPKVESVQKKLNALGFNCGKPDGIFGRRTKKAVFAFQDRYLVDGIVDGITISAINDASHTWSHADKKTILFPVPNGLSEIESVFGVIEYKNKRGGYIEITNDYEKNNIGGAFFHS